MIFSKWFGKKNVESQQQQAPESSTPCPFNKENLKTYLFNALKTLSTSHFPNGITVSPTIEVIEQGDAQFEVKIHLPFPTKQVEAELLKALDDERVKDVKIGFQYSPISLTPSVPKQAKLVIAIASGKGGVGKSTVSANLAAAAAQVGLKVGVLDADIYGPSMPMMFGLQGKNVTSHDGKTMEPFYQHGVYLNSIGFLVPEDKATIWRGPMASKALMQLVNETNWPELDVLFVDMPPGTGDIQLTLSESIKCHGAVIVTTPQNVALADAEKGIQMFNKVSTPVLGIIENMSQFICSECGATHHLFGHGGAEQCSSKHQIPLLGQLSLNGNVRAQADAGIPYSLLDTNLEYQKVVFSLIMQMSKQTQQVIKLHSI